MQRSQFLQSLTNEQAAALLYDWQMWARPEQIETPGDWQTWLVLAGRGFGKTRTGAEWVRKQIESGKCKRMALVARTAADVRDVMVEGESGILAVCPPWNKPHYEPSKRRLTWPNGAIATTYSADQPDLLRGPQHDGAWEDELASWRYPEAHDMLMLGLRLGSDPRTVITTTPRPTKTIKELVKDKTTVVTGGSTYDNMANLARAFIDKIITKYEGTRLGRQELYAQLLDDVPGALWSRDMLDKHRVSIVPELKLVGVAIDPAVTANEESNETGIIVGGLSEDGHGYVIQDDSGKYTPEGWAAKACRLYHLHEANSIIAEVNNGGDLVRSVILNSDQSVRYEAVRASRGKYTRAEPVAQLYEQGKIHHVGMFGELEDQMCSWVPGDDSPDRIDALVWLMTKLMLVGRRKKDARSFQG